MCPCLYALVTRVLQVRTREAFAAKHKNVLRNWGVESSFPPEAVCHTDARAISVADTHVACICAESWLPAEAVVGTCTGIIYMYI